MEKESVGIVADVEEDFGDRCILEDCLESSLWVSWRCCGEDEAS